LTTQDVIENVAIILAAGLFSQIAAGLLRVPRMVVLVGAGALLGPHVIGAIDVPLRSVGVQLLLTLGVAFILFYGGLGLSLRVLRPVAVGLGLLAIPGVVLTAVVTGLVAYVAFDMPFEAALLIGAILAPTDPAILIPLFERLGVRAKVTQTIVAESALNDVTGAVLAFALTSFVIAGELSFAEPLGEFVLDLLISTALGAALGLLLAFLISSGRFGIWRDSPVIAVMLVVAGGYLALDSAGGSGYLGAFLAGLIVGNMDVLGLGMNEQRATETRFFASAMSDVMVIFVFVVLGANLPFDTIPDEAGPALLTLAGLIFLARPLTVLACLLPDRRGHWERNEIVFLAWTRETGVVPAAIAGVVIAEGVPYESEIITVVSLAVVVTLVLQASTKAWLARRLGLDVAEPGVDRPQAGVP
jgi:cell volume regulation protein A